MHEVFLFSRKVRFWHCDSIIRKAAEVFSKKTLTSQRQRLSGVYFL